VIAGKIVAYTILACLQALLLFAVANIAFGMPLGKSPLGLVVVSLIVALTSAALGMLIAALARSANQAASTGLILGLILAVIGGCISMSGQPVFRSGGFMGTLANLTPHAHALEGYYSLMAEDATLISVLPQMGIVLAFGLVFFLVAVWRFKYEQH
jgi:ABC-2 type transport system permease protein